MKPQDIELIYRQKPFELATREVLQALAEQINDMERGVVVLAEVQDRTINQMQSMAMGFGQVANAVDKFKATQQSDDDQSKATRLIGKDE